MRKIRAYTLPCVLKKTFEAELPEDLDILSVTVYHGVPVLYAVTDPDSEKKVKRQFRFFGAEEEIVQNNLTFIGTILVSAGKVCLHLFEIVQPAKGLLLLP